QFLKIGLDQDGASKFLIKDDGLADDQVRFLGVQAVLAKNARAGTSRDTSSLVLCKEPPVFVKGAGRDDVGFGRERLQKFGRRMLVVECKRCSAVIGQD